MNIYPAIDLKSGECVRLFQGRYDTVTIYEKDPIALAKSFSEQGATVLHVVDLDGASIGQSVNFNLISKIVDVPGLKIQTGGGFRTKQQVQNALNSGIFRVVLGSHAILKPDDVKMWINEFGSEKIVLALDVRFDNNGDPKLALQGWQIESQKNLWQLLDEYQDVSLKHVLCTDIQCDGTLQGPNFNLYRECKKRYPTLHFQASGGISTLSDLKKLSEIPISGAIVGKALYENKFSLQDAFNEITS